MKGVKKWARVNRRVIFLISFRLQEPAHSAPATDTAFREPAPPGSASASASASSESHVPAPARVRVGARNN